MAKAMPATNSWHDQVTIEHTTGHKYDELVETTQTR